ncbi:MAG: class I SAM-dependent methyltransferase [bacterium]
MDARALYAQRFDAAERSAKARLWAVLCADFLQPWVRPEDAVLDLGAGFCEFINHIACAAKYALDADPQVREAAAPDVVTRVGSVTDLSWLGDASLDVVFASNLFEHLPDSATLLETLRAIHRVLRPGGRLLILMPNIRFAYREYWDFLDHHLPLSDRSLVEALTITGFAPKVVRPRFLPYTTKVRLPQWPILVRLYLRFPPLHWLLGKQMFVAAERSA